METIVELMQTLGIDWSDIIIGAIAVALYILKKWKGDKVLQDVLHVARIAYSAIEEAGSKKTKKLIKDAVLNAAAKNQPIVAEVNDLLVTVVDEKKPEAVPPIKRFWRRMLNGQNLAGVAVRMAAKAAISKHLEDRE
jgi:hypothetical protein